MFKRILQKSKEGEIPVHQGLIQSLTCCGLRAEKSLLSSSDYSSKRSSISVFATPWARQFFPSRTEGYSECETSNQEAWTLKRPRESWWRYLKLYLLLRYVGVLSQAFEGSILFRHSKHNIKTTRGTVLQRKKGKGGLLSFDRNLQSIPTCGGHLQLPLAFMREFKSSRQKKFIC